MPVKTRKLLWGAEAQGKAKRQNETSDERRPISGLHPCCPGLHVLSVFLAATSTITLHHSSFISPPLSYGVPLYNSVFRLYPVLSSIFHSAPGPLLLHHCRQGDLPRRAVAAFGHMLFHCANEQSPRLLSTLGYAPLSFVAEDANFLRATGCYGGIYPLLQKRFSSACQGIYKCWCTRNSTVLVYDRYGNLTYLSGSWELS